MEFRLVCSLRALQNRRCWSVAIGSASADTQPERAQREIKSTRRIGSGMIWASDPALKSTAALRLLVTHIIRLLLITRESIHSCARHLMANANFARPPRQRKVLIFRRDSLRALQQMFYAWLAAVLD